MGRAQFLGRIFRTYVVAATFLPVDPNLCRLTIGRRSLAFQPQNSAFTADAPTAWSRDCVAAWPIADMQGRPGRQLRTVGSDSLDARAMPSAAAGAWSWSRDHRAYAKT
jgi:hypothetical protein